MIRHKKDVNAAAIVSISDLYVMELGKRSFGVFLKTYLLKKFATKAAAESCMRSIKSRTKSNPKSKKNPFPAMHPIAAAAAGLSAISTALHIHEQVKKSSMKKAPRRKASTRRKTNGTTSAKRQNPQDGGTLQKALNIYNKANLPLAVAYLKRSKLTASQKQNAIDSLKAWDAERKRNPKATKNPTPATLARCRKLLAEDKRSTRKQIAEIPISHYRRVANGKPSKTAKRIYQVRGQVRNTKQTRECFVEATSSKAALAYANKKISQSAPYGVIWQNAKVLSPAKLKAWFENPKASASAKSPVKPVKKNGVVSRYLGRRKAKKEYGRELRLQASIDRTRKRRKKAEARAANPKARSGNGKSAVPSRSPKRNSSVPRRRTFEMFQGRPATKAVPVPVSHFYAGKRFDMLGDLIELKLHSGRVLKFNPTKTKLCAIGGKLILAGEGARVAKPNPAGLANGIDAIDAIDHVVYRTYKPHHGDSPNQQYIHKLGEETGHMPLLCADKQGYAVIRGGRYKIEARGIVN